MIYFIRVNITKLWFGIALCLFLPVSAKAEVYATPDGYKFEVNLLPEKSEMMLDEPIYLDFEVKNLSEVNIGMVQGGDYQNELGRPESFLVKVIDENGNAARKPEIRYNLGGLSWITEIPANQKRIIRLFLPHWATFEKTGNYTIFCERNFVVRKFEKDNSFIYHLKGELVKTTTNVKVIPADYQKMGAIIDSLGKRMINNDDTAKKLLPFVTDKRVIKYFAETIHEDVWVMRFLAKFDDDAALKAIVSRIDDPSEEVRRNVSVTLSSSVHPKAAGYLLKMRGDKFYPIRMDVVHFLGKTNTDEASKILKEMTMDENQQIAEEAQRYLNEREKLNEN